MWAPESALNRLSENYIHSNILYQASSNDSNFISDVQKSRESGGNGD